MVPRPPALETAAARGPEEVRAMPARRIGYLIPRREQRGVWRVGGDIVDGGVASDGWENEWMSSSLLESLMMSSVINGDDDNNSNAVFPLSNLFSRRYINTSPQSAMLLFAYRLSREEVRLAGAGRWIRASVHPKLAPFINIIINEMCSSMHTPAHLNMQRHD